MLYIIISIGIIGGRSLIRDWLLYKHRGHAKLDQKDDPIITGPQDALAQQQIDRIFPKKKSKK